MKKEMDKKKTKKIEEKKDGFPFKSKQTLLSKYNALFQGLQKFKKCKVLIVGDIGLDEYLRGHVSRVSPEAPVPVLEATEQNFALGLAANVAQNIKSLGGEAQLVGIVGKDEASTKLKTLLQSKGISTKTLISDETRITTRKIRILSKNQHMLRLDYEDPKELSKELQKELILQAKKKISDYDGLVIQDYAKGILSENLLQELIEMAHFHKKKVLVDPHRRTPLKHYWGADIFKPNQEESLILSGLKEKETQFINQSETEKEKFYQKVALQLLDQLASEFVVLTRGSEGISLYSQKESLHFPTEAQSVYDVTGAGDTVLAVLSLAVFSKMSLVEASLLSNLAAGQVVQKIGAVSCTKRELEEALKKAKQETNKNKKNPNSYFLKKNLSFLENPLNLQIEKPSIKEKKK